MCQCATHWKEGNNMRHSLAPEFVIIFRILVHWTWTNHKYWGKTSREYEFLLSSCKNLKLRLWWSWAASTDSESVKEESNLALFDGSPTGEVVKHPLDKVWPQTMSADFLRVNRSTFAKKKLYWRRSWLPHFTKNGCLHQTRAYYKDLKVA